LLLFGGDIGWRKIPTSQVVKDFVCELLKVNRSIGCEKMSFGPSALTLEKGLLDLFGSKIALELA
jgi:hypothetical protein